jgi:hypothetical protein
MYKVVKGVMTIDADVIGSVPAFQAMWDADTTEDKSFAYAKLRIAFHMVNPASPFDKSSTFGTYDTYCY